MFVKKRRIDVCDPIHTEREYRTINNPRRMIFLTDVLWNALAFVLFSAILMAVIFAVCAACDIGFRIMGV